MTLVEGELGRLVSLICIDFCGDELVGPLLTRTGANMLLVPSMTTSFRPFKTQAEALGTSNRAWVMVVNSDWIRALSGAEIQHALTYVPIRGGCVTRSLDGDDLVLKLTTRELLS